MSYHEIAPMIENGNGRLWLRSLFLRATQSAAASAHEKTPSTQFVRFARNWTTSPRPKAAPLSQGGRVALERQALSCCSLEFLSWDFS